MLQQFGFNANNHYMPSKSKARELMQHEMRGPIPIVKANYGYHKLDKANSCQAQNDVHTLEEQRLNIRTGMELIAYWSPA